MRTTNEDDGRYGRFRNEVMAGGSVTEQPDGEQVGGGWQGAVGGIVILGLLAWLAVANAWMFVFAIGILISVFLHETGHFVTARMTGMKATQFFLGFGPRLWSFQRGETEYGVRALPLGAFVRIIGMNNLDDVPPGRRSSHVPPEELPAPAARHQRRLADAPADRRRAALHRVLHAGRAGRAAGGRGRAASRTTGRRPTRASRAAT